MNHEIVSLYFQVMILHYHILQTDHITALENAVHFSYPISIR